ncbi:DUF397 domain-containing protein [Kitasatospora sp. NPDC090091]|uniref:DUF397 domain-containing protein n=1 Tax=Kitasatospora sp. NPDC090091 TaxID=3364081 RepID=UPI0038105F74
MARSVWQKSSYSAASDNCVEVRDADGLIELRESDDGDVIVRTTALTFSKFVQDVKAGDFDHFIADA